MGKFKVVFLVIALVVGIAVLYYYMDKPKDDVKIEIYNAFELS